MRILGNQIKQNDQFDAALSTRDDLIYRTATKAPQLSALLF